MWQCISVYVYSLAFVVAYAFVGLVASFVAVVYAALEAVAATMFKNALV